jgi:hypothetical protein
MTQPPLFPDIELGDDRRRRSGPLQKGHAAAPGTGPKGETCGTCRHPVRVQLSSKAVFKCGLARRYWTGGTATDIRCKDAACGFWRSVEKTETTETTHDTGKEDHAQIR